MNSADSDSNDGHLGPRSDREWRRQYGPAIGAEVVQRLPCGWRRGCRSLRAKLCFDRGNVFQYWRTKLEEACVSCFAPQIPAWNDSDGEALALVFAQEHGAGLEAWQTRSHREDSDSVNPGSNPGPSARQSGLRGFISRCVRIRDIPAGYAGAPQSLAGNLRHFGPQGAGFGRRSLLAIFQFPFSRG